MPKAKPVSLHPLNFEEAIKALITVEPQHVSAKRKRKPRKLKKFKKSQ